MALKYHINGEGEWTRCVASTPDACPFKDRSHGDRTGIARDHNGGIVQDSAAREAVITPVVGGVYAVFTDTGARTYTEKGDLIAASDRAAYLQKAVVPKLRAAATDATASPQDRAVADLMTQEVWDKDGQQFKQWVLPSIEFSDKDDTVVIRRSAPVPTPSPASPAAPTTANAQQSAKAQAKAVRQQRRKSVVKQCRRAIRMGKAYSRTMNKAVSKTTGVGGGKGSKADNVMDGFLFWFLDLFDVK